MKSGKCLILVISIYLSHQAAVPSDIVAATTGAISTVTWKAGPAGAEVKHASISFVNNISVNQNVLQFAGGSPTNPLFKVAAKVTGPNSFSLIMIDHANNEIDGGYVNQPFH